MFTFYILAAVVNNPWIAIFSSYIKEIETMNWKFIKLISMLRLKFAAQVFKIQFCTSMCNLNFRQFLEKKIWPITLQGI